MKMSNKIYVVIDVGCHECGESSTVLKVFKYRASAEKFKEDHSVKTGNWGEIGQVIPEVFEVVVD